MPGALLQQIAGMDVGSIELGAGNDFTVTRSDGSQYVFENVAQDASSVVSATASLYDSNGTLTDTVAVNRLTVLDANRVDFETRIRPAGGNATRGVGSLTGLRGTRAHTAMAMINADGESRVMMVDYSGLDESGPESSLQSLVTVTSMDPGDGTANLWGSVLEYVEAASIFPEGLVLAAVVVLFVAITCLAFGWWGC